MDYGDALADYRKAVELKPDLEKVLAPTIQRVVGMVG